MTRVGSAVADDRSGVRDILNRRDVRGLNIHDVGHRIGAAGGECEAYESER